MGNRCRFVQPEIVRIPLSDGDFIDVKHELTAGEYRHLFAKQVKSMPLGGERAALDPEQIGKAKIVEYLVGWSFVDAHGTPVQVSESAIDTLDQESYRELVVAIDAHEAQIERAREEKKRLPATVSG